MKLAFALRSPPADLAPVRRQPSTAPLELAALRYLLEHTRSQLADAQEKLRAREQEAMRAALYGEIGLHPDCPDFVLKAVRRAYRRELHPDGKAPALRAEAERCFKSMESIFSRIEHARA